MLFESLRTRGLQSTTPCAAPTSTAAPIARSRLPRSAPDVPAQTPTRSIHLMARPPLLIHLDGQHSMHAKEVVAGTERRRAVSVSQARSGDYTSGQAGSHTWRQRAQRMSTTASVSVIEHQTHASHDERAPRRLHRSPPPGTTRSSRSGRLGAMPLRPGNPAALGEMAALEHEHQSCLARLALALALMQQSPMASPSPPPGRSALARRPRRRATVPPRQRSSATDRPRSSRRSSGAQWFMRLRAALASQRHRSYGSCRAA